MFKIILWSDYFERTLVWTMVWNSSGQWSGTCLIRGHFGLELAWSEAASSALRAHNDLRAHSRLIRGHFGLGWSDQRSHLSGTVWSEAISSVTSTWAVLDLGLHPGQRLVYKANSYLSYFSLFQNLLVSCFVQRYDSSTKIFIGYKLIISKQLMKSYSFCRFKGI